MFSCVATQNQVDWVQVSSNKPVYRPRSCWLKTVSLDVRNMEAPHLSISTFKVRTTKENLLAYQGGYVLGIMLVSSKKIIPCISWKLMLKFFIHRAMRIFLPPYMTIPDIFVYHRGHMNSMLMKTQRIQRAMCSDTPHPNEYENWDRLFWKIEMHYFSPFEV